MITGARTGAVLALLMIVGTIFVVGCQNNSKPDPIRGNAVIRYFHDDRTDLCFAAMNSTGAGGYESTSITNVPCTDKVQAIIHGN